MSIIGVVVALVGAILMYMGITDQTIGDIAKAVLS